MCPSSGDTPDPSAEQIGIDFWHDFAGYGHISYGYMVPFGPRDTRPRDGADNRQILVAEKGPFCAPETIPDWDVGADGPIGFDDFPMRWRRFNSPNHGGKRSGRGQNCLYGDGHGDLRTPTDRRHRSRQHLYPDDRRVGHVAALQRHARVDRTRGSDGGRPLSGAECLGSRGGLPRLDRLTDLSIGIGSNEDLFE